jgi:thioredoxin 1
VATLDVTKDNFSQTVDSSDMVIVDFWAPWCGPCKSFAPVYEEISVKHDDIVFAKVNTEEEQELAAHFQIRSIPTLMILKEQVVVFAQPGALPGSALEEIIGKTRELDMDKVRAEIASQEATQGQA